MYDLDGVYTRIDTRGRRELRIVPCADCKKTRLSTSQLEKEVNKRVDVYLGCGLG